MRLIRNTFFLRACRLGAIFLALLAGLFATPAFSQERMFPNDSYQVNLDAINTPYVTISGTTVQMASGILIFTEDGRTITQQQLVTDHAIRVEFNGQCQIKRMWMLKWDEAEHIPWWRRMLMGSFTLPCTPS
jgi:hypothetical protein